ncbi:MAG TPA: uracil-DNA glycosylase [Herpetosiphonaceae bacterium]|nr:uracil-DNA glycosylase [Herpetosiphonaceae bacterium]
MNENRDEEAIAAALAEIAAEVNRCTACELHKGRTRAVPGEGPTNAKIMFIGEAPGRNEDQQGRPFVGQAGRLLEELLAEIGLTRDDAWIGNIVKCRPPDNRDPWPEEIAACAGYLERQIALLQPKLIATLGRYSMEKFFPGAKITRVHGQARRDGNRVLIPLFHPAYILRNMAAMPDAVRDMQKIPRLLARLDEVLREEAASATPAQSPAPPAPEPEQLSLF